MKTPLLTSHLTTINKFVQREIVKKNISQLLNFKSNSQFHYYPFEFKKEIQNKIDRQISILEKIENEIKIQSQTCLTFFPIVSKKD